MPLRRIGLDDRGRAVFVRLPYDPRAYAVPSEFVGDVRKSFGEFGSREILTMGDGPFTAFVRVRELERDGKRYVLLRRAARSEWAIEVELTDDTLGDIRELSPEEAWALARERDAAHDPAVELADK